jgi:Flp pilus assembly protein TadG
MMAIRKLANTTGSEIAEAALVLPIFFTLMLGIYWFGRAFNTYATINHAAREAARFAVAQNCATCGTPNGAPSPDNVALQLQQFLKASSLDPGQVTNLGGTRLACNGGTVACSAITVGTNACVRFNVQLPNTSPAGSGSPACGVSVEFQYPYQFALPFTSLNSQRIMLNAGVQMAGEY